MRSGGSVLEAPPGAEEGALPREHRPQAGCAELTRASSACRIYKLFTYAEKALRYPGEPFLYVLDLAKLNLDGIAAMRNGEAPSSRRLAHSLIGAPMRGHSPASIVRVPVVRNCAASIVRRANLTYSASVKLNFDGIAAMRSGGSVLEAPPGAEEGALPREHRPRAGRAELTRASSASRLCRTYASILCVPDSRPAARASASTLEPLDMNF